MSFTLDTDSIITIEDARDLFSMDNDDKRLVLLLNAMTKKFKNFTNRVQINEDQDTAIVQKLTGLNSKDLYVGAPVFADATHDVEADLYLNGELNTSYKYSDDEIDVISNDRAAYLQLNVGCWPDETYQGYIQVTYFGGWATIPPDVIQGALMQGKMDLKRMDGEIGALSNSRDGQSVRHDNAGIIKTVRNMWAPYVMEF